MRTILFLLLLFFSASALPAQTDSIGVLEARLDSLEGPEAARLHLDLADLHLRLGDYREAERQAERAQAIAESHAATELLARALNRRGRALLISGNNRQARKVLWESVHLVEVTEDAGLMMDNLEQLRELASKTMRKSELQDIEARMAALERALMPPPAPLEIRPPRRADGRLTPEIVIALPPPPNATAEQVDSLERERVKLQSVVDRQRAEIDSMSTRQMRQQLTLARQQNLLDSLQIRGLRDSLLLSQKEILLSNQEARLEVQRSRSRLFVAFGIIGLLLAGGLTALVVNTRRHNAVLEEKNTLIQREKQRSEELLLNILPVAVAEELKTQGMARTRRFEHVTVMFSDFEDFSRIAHHLSPEALVRELDHCFRAFDAIVERHGLEKIKTIGDAYMCAGGLPIEDPAHAEKMVRAALEFQQFLDRWKQEKQKRGEPTFEARIGIHTGPIIAGVVGVKKFAYDIWGDTVNVAARMEAAGEPGRINISQSTYRLIQDQFRCTYRGKVPAKNLGEIDMYFVEEK